MQLRISLWKIDKTAKTLILIYIKLLGSSISVWYDCYKINLEKLGANILLKSFVLAMHGSEQIKVYCL